MPNDPLVPVIMVSAGSGIAPFRAFWQQRIVKQYPKSSAWLYFGCRDVTENMFSDETSKVVQRRVAFSRIDRERKEYVQDLIEQDCAQVYDMIANHQAHIYICGKVLSFDFVHNIRYQILLPMPTGICTVIFMGIHFDNQQCESQFI